MLLLPIAARTLTAQAERRTLSGDRVAVYNIAGELTIERGRGRDVEVEVTRRGADASQLRIETGTVRGIPTLRVIYPDDDIVYDGGRERSRWGRTQSRIRDDGTWGSGNWSNGRQVTVRSSGRGLEAWADIRISVPDGQTLDAYLLVGELRATDVDGTLSLDVGAARVTAERIRGLLDVDAGSGGVVLRDIQSRQLTVDNGSGGVTFNDVRSDVCNLDSGSGGVTGTNVSCDRLDIDIGSGGVRLDEATLGTVTVDAGSGGVSLGMRQNPRSVAVEAGSGTVTLTMPSSLSASLDISTGSGGISTDFPVRTSSVERSRLRGTVGDGAARITIENGSGGVRLRRSGN